MFDISTVGGRFIDFLSDPAMVRFVENEVNRLEQFDLGAIRESAPGRGCAGERATPASSPGTP